MMVAMTNTGILNYKLTPSIVDASHLLSQLMDFNGVNPHSIMILENCAIHHVEDIVQLFNKVESWFIFYHCIVLITIPLRKPFLM